MGSMMYAGIAGMSVFLLWVASTTPQMMEHLVPTFHAEPIPIGGSSKFEKYLQKWELQMRNTLSARSGAQAIFKPSPTVLARLRFRSARRGISAPAFYENRGLVSPILTARCRHPRAGRGRSAHVLYSGLEWRSELVESRRYSYRPSSTHYLQAGVLTSRGSGSFLLANFL